MPSPLEHDYIGLGSSEKIEEDDSSTNNALLHLKQTELRLGLPGSESPERRTEMGLSLSLKGVEAEAKAEAKAEAETSNGLFSFLPGAKRGFSDASEKWGFSENGTKDVADAAVSPLSTKKVQEKKSDGVGGGGGSSDQSPPTKAQLVGWPPVRSFRKNTAVANPVKNGEEKDGKSGQGCLYVKVSMDGAPYLRKVDLKTYSNYRELSAALEEMFSCFTIGQCGSHGVQGRNGQSESRLMDVLRGSECVLTFEDKDGDWMLVGDVPWDMFIDSCKKLRIMKGSNAIGLAPKAMEKSKNWS